MKKTILTLIVVIITISTSVNAQISKRKAAELYVNFAEDIMDTNNANEKSVDEAILNLEKAIKIDRTYGEPNYLLGITILKKIDFIKWRSKIIERRGKNNSKLIIELIKLQKRAKDAFLESILLGEENKDAKEIIRKLNFELIGERVYRKQRGIGETK